MRPEVQTIADGLVAAAEKAAGDVAKKWTFEDRAKIVQAGEAVAKYAFLAKADPGLAEIDRPIIESVVARLKSISVTEAGEAAHSFFTGALEVLKVGLPIVLQIVSKV